jgi:hypothetical protein
VVALIVRGSCHRGDEEREERAHGEERASVNSMNSMNSMKTSTMDLHV